MFFFGNSLKKIQPLEHSTPELHLMMGSTNKLFNLVKKVMEYHGREEAFDKWCKKCSITRRGHNDNQLDGNNCKAFMRAIKKLQEAKLAGPEAAEDAEKLLPSTGLPILDALAALETVVKSTMSHTLAASFKEDIQRYKDMRAKLPESMMAAFGLKVGYSWKEHVLLVHLEPWLEVNQIGLASLSEQASESIHHVHNVRSWNHFKVPEGHKQYANRIKASVVKLNSMNLGFDM